MGSGIISRHRKAIGIYLLWLLINGTILFLFADDPTRSPDFGHLLYQHNDYGGRGRFWPIMTLDVTEYDISEFLFYMIVPAIIYVAISLLKPKKIRNSN